MAARTNLVCLLENLQKVERELVRRRYPRSPLGSINQIEGFQNNPVFDNLARFAVDDHNKKQNSLLEFKKVTNVKKHMVGGVLYYLTLEAADGGQKKVYEAKVCFHKWQNLKVLVEFKPMGSVEPTPTSEV